MSQESKRSLPNLSKLSNRQTREDQNDELGEFKHLKADEMLNIISKARDGNTHPRDSCRLIKQFCSLNKEFKKFCDANSDKSVSFWKDQCRSYNWRNPPGTKPDWKEYFSYRCQRVHTNETLRKAVNALATGDDSYAEITNKYGTIDEWDVAYVTDMSNLFRDFTSRYPLTTYDISRWDTGRVTTMDSMFDNAKIKVTAGTPFFTWNTSKVITFASMFHNFGEVTDSYDHSSRFNGGFTGWNTSSATDMSEMFSNCSLNPYISPWNVSSVTTMRKMFYHNWAFNRYLGLWNVDRLSDMSFMFYQARRFQGDGLDEWYNPPEKTMPSVEYMAMMFADAIELSVNLASWAPVVRKWLVKNETYANNGRFDKWAHPRSLFLMDGESADPEWFRALVQEFDPDPEEED